MQIFSTFIFVHKFFNRAWLRIIFGKMYNLLKIIYPPLFHGFVISFIFKTGENIMKLIITCMLEFFKRNIAKLKNLKSKRTNNEITTIKNKRCWLLCLDLPQQTKFYHSNTLFSSLWILRMKFVSRTNKSLAAMICLIKNYVRNIELDLM